MAEEFFNIVDKNNKELGQQKPRSVVHQQGCDWHRAISVWVINDKKEILCQKRSRNKDSDPGKWQSYFGGHLTGRQVLQQLV